MARISAMWPTDVTASFVSLRHHLGQSMDADAWHARFPWMTFGLTELCNESACNQSPFDEKCNLEVRHTYNPVTYWTMTHLTLVLQSDTERKLK